AEENVRQFLEILDDPKYYPVLVHCFAGTHRTGAYCAIYQMEYEHASNDDAIQELFAEGYDNLFAEDDVRGFLKAYGPRWNKWMACDYSPATSASTGSRQPGTAGSASAVSPAANTADGWCACPLR